MPSARNSLPLLALALLSLPLSACNEEYSDRATEIETDPPAVAPTAADSAAAGAQIDTIDPLTTPGGAPQPGGPGGGS